MGAASQTLAAAGIPADRCFFTNAFLGLCEGDNSLNYRGREHSEFRAACSAFLRFQIAIQRPRLLLTLGLHVPPILAELSPDLSFWIQRKLTLKDFDGVPMVGNAGFCLGNGSTHRAVVMPLAHPSKPNSRHRKPTGYSPGRLGEVEVVRDGWQESLREPV